MKKCIFLLLALIIILSTWHIASAYATQINIIDANNNNIKISNDANASITVMAFKDDNLDGVRGKYEEPMPDIDVDLIDCNGNVINSLRTSANASHFYNIPPGEYSLIFRASSDLFFTGVGKSNISHINSIAPQSLNGHSQTKSFNLSAGQNIYACAGLFFSSSMSGRIWLDENNNGIMDDEPSFNNISIEAYSKATGYTYTANISNEGEWSISNIPYGEYELKATLPEGYLFALYSLEGRELRSIFTEFYNNHDTRVYTLGKGQNLNNLNIGVVKLANTEVTAFYDSNYNGIMDDDELGIADIKVEFIRDNLNKIVAKGKTAENGKLYMPTIRQNNYRIRAILPNKHLEFSQTNDGDMAYNNHFANVPNRQDSNIYNIKLLNNKKNKISIGIAQMIDFTGKIYIDKNVNGAYDPGEKPLAGVEVKAYNEQNNLVYTTKSNANGEYRILGLYAGKIKLQFSTTNDCMYVCSHGSIKNYINKADGSNAYTDFIPLVMGQAIHNVDAGLIPKASISGKIFEDLNDNGLDDDAKGFANMQVALLDTDKNIILETTSDDNGNYIFDGVIPGTYSLRYTLPNNAEFAEYNKKGNTFNSTSKSYVSDPFKFTLGNDIVAKLGGALHMASISGKLYIDSNANGQNDDNNVLSNVKLIISLTNPKQNKIELTASKEFNINNLRPGKISIDIQLDNKYIFSNNKYNLRGSHNTLVIDQFKLLQNSDIDIPAIRPSSIKTSAWLDENMDNIHNSSDKPYKQAKFLLIASNGNVEEYMADDSGNLCINNIVAGNYKLGLLLSSDANVMQNLATKRLNNKILAYRNISILEGSDIDVDSYGVQELMSISGKLGVQLNNVFKPVHNHTLKLLQNNKLIATCKTNEQGKYEFTKLKPGTYHIETETIDNAIFTIEDDKNYPNSYNGKTLETGMQSKPLIITMPESLKNIDFIAIRPAKIGDYVWVDINKNGLQDSNEPAFANIDIALIKDNEVKYNMQSDGNGFYEISNIYPDKYILRISLPKGFGITKPNPEYAEISSVLQSVNSNNYAYSSAFTVHSGEMRYNVDIGLKLLDGYNLPQNINNPTFQDWSKQVEQFEKR